MAPRGPVSLILVSSCGWKSFAGGVPIGLQTNFYIQSKKALLHFIQFFKGLCLLFWKLISSIWNVVLQPPYTKLCCAIMKWMLQIFPSLFCLFILTFHQRNSSASCITHMLMKIIYWKLNYCNFSNAFCLKCITIF